jgi:hypothetical protein
MAVICDICGAEVSDMAQHLKEKHPNRPDETARLDSPPTPKTPAKPKQTWPPK